MARLKLIDSGIFYINPNPSDCAVWASHARPVQLSERELICTYARGAAKHSLDMNVALLRSLDGGVTWTHEGFLYDKSRDDRLYSYHDGYMSRMSDGTVVVFPFRADRSEPGKSLFSPTGGLLPCEPVLLLSDDGGRTWVGPQPFGLPPGMIATPSHPILELQDGRWMATLDQWHAYDEPGPYRPRMLAFFSADHGRTWGDMVVMADGNEEGKGFWHGKTIRLADGRLFMTVWSADLSDRSRGPAPLPVHYALADPTGRRWSRPQPTNLMGETTCPAELPGGRIGAIYTSRDDQKPGIRAILSEDGGRTWDVENQVQVWDATGWTYIGISNPHRYPKSHDTVAYGGSHAMATREGDLFASWWCTFASLVHIRWARLRAID